MQSARFLRKLLFYTVGVLLCTLLINLGSSWYDPMARLKSVPFRTIMLMTVPLLFVYLMLLSWFINFWYTDINGLYKLPRKWQFILFVLLATSVIVALHMMVLHVAIGLKTGKSIFSMAYFRADFWFFIMPLLSYCCLLFARPQASLLPFQNTRKALLDHHALLHERAVLDSAYQELQQHHHELSNDHNHLLQHQEGLKTKIDALLAESLSKQENNDDIIKEIKAENIALKTQLDLLSDQEAEKPTKMFPSLQKYELDANGKWPLAWTESRIMDTLMHFIWDRHLSHAVPPGAVRRVYEVMLILKLKKYNLGVYVSGEKWVLEDEEAAILLRNPWMVTVNADLTLNMLYCNGKFLPGVQGCGKFNILIDDFCKNVLDEKVKHDKLKKLLLSRHFRKGFEYFWEPDRLLKMDAAQLYDTLGKKK